MSLKTVSKPTPYKYEIYNIIKDAIIENSITENQVLNEQEYADYFSEFIKEHKLI